MKYVIKFEKTGVICYTSHLDILKVFKRSFKRADIRLDYSKGFNPHPKMGFAQPLSLGYSGYCEYLEFETIDESKSPEEIISLMRAIMPEGLNLISIKKVPELKKTLASLTVAADYSITVPVETDLSGSELDEKYMNQPEIRAFKRQKKKKEPVLVNIKPKIRRIDFRTSDDCIRIDCCLDAGSESNLSPELVIDSFIECFGFTVDKADIHVSRTNIQFKE